MYKSPSALSEDSRMKIAEALNARLADGIDLYTQVKVAHWNIRGPHFASLHELFDEIAKSVASHNDNIAERAVVLAGRAYGTARHVANASRIPEYPQETTRDLEHVRLVAERVEKYLEGLRETRGLAEKNGDTDTVDLLTEVVTAFEKYGWFLRATLAQ
jgi:starvation-inducible DNA-binding protein